MNTTGAPLIFVVDDEQVIASTVAMILKQQGYDARPFFDPLQVLSACKDTVPFMLISDVAMPQMTGVELAIEMQELYPACKLLLFSGHAAASMYIENATRRGYSFDVVAKPIHPVDLLKRVDSCAQRNGTST